MQKINDIWIPDENFDLSTNGLKKWILFCKLQYKKFKTVFDCDAQYGIWSRSMRHYAKKIISFENNKSYVPYCEKNTAPHNNIDFRKQILNDSVQPPQTFTIDYFNLSDVELIKINSANTIRVFSGAPKTLGQNDENQSNVKFVYIENINNDVDTFVKSLKYKMILDNNPDRVYYK